jgi:hypothetical protein
MASHDNDNTYCYFDLVEMNLPPPLGNVRCEGNEVFAWLEGSHYWEEFYDLPDDPSWRFSEDDLSSPVVQCKKRELNRIGTPGKLKRRTRFFHAIPKLPNIRGLEEDEDDLEHSLANKPVPAHVRAMEVELVQRHLPSYPSQTHRKKASFYPLMQDTLDISRLNVASISRDTDVSGSARMNKFVAFYRSRLQARKDRRNERQERNRLLKERREHRRATKEARRRSQGSEKRGRKQSYKEDMSKEQAVPPTGAMVDVCASSNTSEERSDKSRIKTSLDTSQSTVESCNPSINESSKLSSVGSFSDDELLDQSMGDDEYITKELDFFYSEEKLKMQQVHSRHIGDAEREQRERRLDAEYMARVAKVEMERQQEGDTPKARARRLLHHPKQLASKLENYRVRMALYLTAKWAEEDAIEGTTGTKRDLESPPFQADSQYQFLRDFYLDRGVLRLRLFSRNTHNDRVVEEKDSLVSSKSERIDDLQPRQELSPLSLVRSLSENFYTSVRSLPSNYERIEEHYEPQIGVIPPTVQAQILQAQVEMRSRKVPEEHKMKFVPASLEASEVGRFTRLNEVTVEAYGTKRQEVNPKLPSEIWKHGQERVSLPKMNDASASNTFTIFNEAAALGKIKALKPQVVSNFDILSELNLDSEVDIDDENKHKAMRTNFLTDVYVQGHRQHKKDDLWVDADLTEEIRYNSLEDVQLPTEKCPIVKPAPKKLSMREINDAIAQAVAESAWERRYRLERPHAEQRITRTCSCKYCENANPYQTHAYRKKWLVQQGLWNEPEEAFVATTTLAEEMTVMAMQSGSEDSHGDEDEEKKKENEEKEVEQSKVSVDLFEPVIDDLLDFHVVDEEILNLHGNECMNQNIELDNHDQRYPLPDADDVWAVPKKSFPSNERQEGVKCDTEFVKSDVDCKWSTDEDALLEDSTPHPKKPRRSRSFLSEIGSVLGLLRVDDNDTSVSAKAQRLRRTRRHNRLMKRKSKVR